jgi:hypothetical protein
VSTAFDTLFVAELRAALGRELKAHENTILEGTVDKFEDYKRQVGIRSGLMRALELTFEIEKKLTSPPQEVTDRRQGHGLGPQIRRNAL